MKNLDFEQLSKIAPLMESLKKKEDATVFYDALSGSLIWSDEFPRKLGVNYDCLRYIFNYRTGLIIGEARPDFEIAWQEALQRFPLWIGFSPERVKSNEILANIYFRERRKIMQM